VSQDWTLTCSKEFGDYIDTDPFKDNDILKLLFQLLNMPTNKDEIDIKCKNLKRHMDVNGYLTFKDLLIFEAGMTGAMMADDSELKEDPLYKALEEPLQKMADLLSGKGRLNKVKGEGGTGKTETPKATATATATATTATPAPDATAEEKAKKQADYDAKSGQVGPIPLNLGGGSRRLKRSSLSSSRKRKTPRKLQRRSVHG